MHPLLRQVGRKVLYRLFHRGSGNYSPGAGPRSWGQKSDEWMEERDMDAWVGLCFKSAVWRKMESLNFELDASLKYVVREKFVFQVS